MPIAVIALLLIFVFFSYLQHLIFNNVFTHNITLETILVLFLTNSRIVSTCIRYMTSLVETFINYVFCGKFMTDLHRQIIGFMLLLQLFKLM